MPPRVHRFAVCLALGSICWLAILLSGCGSSSSAGDPSSRSAVLSSVESICAKGHARREHLFATVAKSPRTREELNAVVLKSVVGPSAQVAHELAALDAPDDLRFQLDRLVQTIEVENKKVEEGFLPDVYHDLLGTYEATDDTARLFGLARCAEL
jgi:hypothetical protein